MINLIVLEILKEKLKHFADKMFEMAFVLLYFS